MKASNAIRPIILAVSCLVLGFVGGWSLASLGGDTVDLPEADVDVTVARPNPQTATATGAPTSTGTSTTGTGTSATTGTSTTATTATETTATTSTAATTTSAATTTATTAASTRAGTSVRVLNGSGVAGRAAQTASRLAELGYAGVTTGNTGSASGVVVYYADGEREAAQRLVGDLEAGTTAPLTGTALASAVPQGTDLVVVLGG